MSTTVDRPLPDVSPRMQPFWDAARKGRLLLPRCKACGCSTFPAVESCSRCLASDFEWTAASGRGTVLSFVVMHQVYHPAFADEVPYAVVDIRLEEGPRMISRILDCPPAEVRIGMNVEITFVTASDTISLPMFRVVPG